MREERDKQTLREEGELEDGGDCFYQSLYIFFPADSNEHVCTLEHRQVIHTITDSKRRSICIIFESTYYIRVLCERDMA